MSLGNLLADFWVNTVIVGFIVITGFVLSYTVIRQDPKSITNKIVAVLFSSIVLWILFAHLGDNKLLRDYSIYFNRLVYGCLFYWFYSLAVLPFVFPTDTNIIKKPLRVAFISIVSVLAVLAATTDKFLAKVELHDWGANNIDGPWITVIYGFTVLSILPMIRFFWVYKRSNQDEKKQLRYFFLGLILFIIFVLFIYLGVKTITGTDQYYRYGNYSAVFLIGFTAYAIIKHHLFDVRVILTEAAVILINVVSAVQIFSANSVVEAVFRTFFLAVILYGSILLVKSVKREIQQRQEIEKLAKELKVANEHLKEVDKLKDDFLSMASHELNTPIAAIKGYLSMILVEGLGGKIPEKARGYLESVYKSSERLANMVKDLLNVSRIESNRIHIIWEQKPIEDMVNQAITEVMSKAREAKHTLTFEAPKHKMPLTWFDQTRITEVLINILGNAIKYTPDGGKITVRVINDDEKLVVSVEDNGKGIPKDRQQAVFEKFTQVDVLKDEVKGTGLGMYISQKFIQLHKGKIWFHSDGENKGTTFFFSLPIYQKKPFDPHEGQEAVLH